MSSSDWKRNIEEEEKIKKEESDEEDAGNFEYKKKIIERIAVGHNREWFTEQSTEQSIGPCHCQENIEDFKDGLIITTVTTTTTVIFYGLRAVGAGQPKTLLISTAVACLLPNPM